MANWMKRLLPNRRKKEYDLMSYLKYLATGSFYKMSDVRSESDALNIKNQIDIMRALAADSQINTALSYYATDATTTNSSGQIIWATSERSEIADVINQLFKAWNINSYARDHILELATIGNLYIPTTLMYKDHSLRMRERVVLDNNTIPDSDFNIIPSTKISTDAILHLYYEGESRGYIYKPDSENEWNSDIQNLPEDAVIHFSLGGLLGNYTINCYDKDNNETTYDIMFAEPLMAKAVQPTQTLSLLEDAVVLSSLSKTIRFINVDCGNNNLDETEIAQTLTDIKNAIEQNMSINTNSGDVQSYVNPQSPNNLIYLPKIDGADPISITDLNMQTDQEGDSKLLDYYMDKKLSVLGVPKEAMNFSSNEGLGGAGSVMSQRSALYANSLNRLMTAYMQGWTNALNAYFINRGMSGFVDNFELHMNPIITQQSTIQFERRDSALSQAQAVVDLFKDAGIDNRKELGIALSEILSEVFPQMGSSATGWNIDLSESEEGGLNDAV